MSFSVSVKDTILNIVERLNGIFSNRSNLLNFKFLRMFFDIIKFYKKCDNLNQFNEEITLGEYLKKIKSQRIYRLSFNTYGFSYLVYATI